MKKILTFLASCLLATLLTAQVTDTLNVNNVSVTINASNVQFGKLSPDTFTGGMTHEEHFEFPASSGINTFFTSSLWLTAKDLNGSLFASVERFGTNGNDFATGPLDSQGQIHPDTITKYNRVWSISRADIERFTLWFDHPSTLPNYTPSSDIINWPAGTASHPLAPFVDVNNNNKYDPLTGGDYPDIKGDKAIFTVLNDVGANQGESDGLPMGMEVHALFYAYDCPQSDAVNNAIFASYKIINQSQEIYKDFTLTVFADVDIGHFFNYAGTDVANSMMYCYQLNPSNNPYGDTAVAAGAIILRGPKHDDNQKDDASNSYHGINGVGFGDGIVDNEYFGLTNSMYFNNTTQMPQSHASTDPYTNSEYFYYVRNFWKDMNHLTYGGNGYDSTTVNSRYAFPGDSDPWNASTGFQAPPFATPWLDTINESDDRRLLLSTGNNLFMIPGEVMTLDVAYCNAMVDGGTKIQAVNLLRAYADSLHGFFRSQNFPCNPGSPTSCQEKKDTRIRLSVYPNPASDVLTVEVEKNHSYHYRLFNLVGEEISSSNGLRNTSKINLSGFKPGMYILEINTDSNRFIRKIIKE